MKNIKKKLVGAAFLGLGVVLLSGCTQNFCSSADRAEMLYPYEQGVTVYGTEEEFNAYKASEDYTSLSAADKAVFDSVSGLAISGNATIYRYVPFTRSETGLIVYGAKKAALVNSILNSAKTNGYYLPSVQYWAEIDQKVLDLAVSKAVEKNDGLAAADITLNSVENGSWCVNPYVESDTTGEGATIIPLNQAQGAGNSILRYFGGLKFTDFYGDNYKEDSRLYGWVKELRASDGAGLGIDGSANDDFLTLYRGNVLSTISNKKSCIATETGSFGHYGSSADWEVSIETKSWADAWNKGFFEGLLVYPISWLLDRIAFGIDPNLSGGAQIAAIIIVALIVRTILALIGLRGTISQQKMQALQPQVAKIQAKYPNANTNQAEKMRLSQETQSLYKRNGVSMFAPFLILIFQFPVFICVWDAMNGNAALSTGSFLGLSLSDTIQSALFNISGTWYANTHGWWTALVLYILMAGSQFMSVLTPRLIQKHQRKGLAKMGRNPAEDQQAKTGKYMMYGMVIFTMIMGFFLPSAMGVYWFIGAIISMLQTLITQFILAKRAKNKKGK
ncbi:MAG: membrane protein insertase YidC [Bacilli bacterium]|nr:membrane protein insertase YidC [Bacilli bacterium]